MKINQKKLARQLGIIDKWMAAGCKGTLEAVTGFGKTYVLILIIKRFHAKYPDYPVDIVLPKTNLCEAWTHPTKGHIVKHGLSNVFAFVVNTYIKFERRFPAILGLDEVHNYASEEFGKVFEIAGAKPVGSIEKGPHILGLTATLQRNDGKHRFIENYCPVIDTVGLDEAKREGYVSKSKTYNLGIHLNEEDEETYKVLDGTFRNAFAKFNHDFDLAMACCKPIGAFTKLTVPVKVKEMKNGNPVLIERMTELVKNTGEWLLYFAQYNLWDGSVDHAWSPKAVARIAHQFSASMRGRKTFLYTAPSKIDEIEKIVNKFPYKTVTFSENSDFADAVVERLGEERCKSYHSKTKGITTRVEVMDKKGRVIYKDKKIGSKVHKQNILAEFMRQGTFQVLSTVKSLDEGFDYQGVKIGIQASYTSTKRQNTQRTGRATRLDEEDETKMALNINLYVKGTQEEKWLNDKQRGITDVEWVDSVDEIDFTESIEENLSLV